MKTQGVVHPKNTMFLRVYVGKAKSPDDTFEMSTNAGDGSPIIYHEGSKRFWSIGWQELIEMAVAAGIKEKAS